MGAARRLTPDAARAPSGVDRRARAVYGRGRAGSGPIAKNAMRQSIRGGAVSAAAAIRSGSRNAVYRITAAILACAIGLVSLVLGQYWVNTSKDARDRGANLAFLLAEQTTRTFQAVDLTLGGLEPVLEAEPLPEHAPSFERLLQQRIEALDVLHALYVVDPTGRVTQRAGPLGDVISEASARPYFADFRRNPSLKFLIGRPLFSSPGRLSAIPVMRRLTSSGGEFDGMMVASVEPRYFRDFYRNLDLGRRGAVDLYQDNGSILLASTGDDGSDDAVTPLTRMPTFDLASTLGNFRSPASESNRRLVAFHRATGYPLVVAVSIDLADLRARWWRVAGPSLAAVAAIVVLAVAVAALVTRRIEERTRDRHRAATMQKLEALGQMTASVSHDFRNLLAVMTATLRIVRRRGPDETVLRAAEEAVERGSRLITQLLAFSKRDDLQIVPASIEALLDGLEGVLRHAAGPDVSLVVEKAGGLPPCDVDPVQFDAALMNLVVNARQAMPEGGRITVSTRAAGAKGVEVRVADAGTGIAPGDMKRIFEPFFTTKAETGTGLGLAQVYGFMRRVGGDVRVESELGVGTTFTLLFRAASSDAQREAARPAA